jgi:hypothetical protein
METLTEEAIRAAFVNCTKGEAKRAFVPTDLAAVRWDDLDYFGWRDPRTRDRAYLVAELGQGPQALVLRAALAGRAQRRMCSICLTTRDGGVGLVVAPLAGKAGQQGNSVGTYLCSDLDCSLYVRGLKNPGRGVPKESITVEEKIRRTVANLTAFMAKVTA